MDCCENLSAAQILFISRKFWRRRVGGKIWIIGHRPPIDTSRPRNDRSAHLSMFTHGSSPKTLSVLRRRHAAFGNPPNSRAGERDNCAGSPSDARSENQINSSVEGAHEAQSFRWVLHSDNGARNKGARLPTITARFVRGSAQCVKDIKQNTLCGAKLPSIICSRTFVLAPGERDDE